MSGYSRATSWKVRHQRSWPKVSTLVLATRVSCFLLVSLAGVVEGPADAALAALAGVDGRLHGDFVGRALLEEPAHAAVHVFGVLADDDEVDVVGPLAGQRRLHAGEQLHRAEVDVLVEAEPQFQEQALLHDSRRHVGMADGAEQDGAEAARVRRAWPAGRISPVRR